MFAKDKMQWADNIWAKPKLRIFVMIKLECGTENDVVYNLSKRQRSLCAQVRSGVLLLKQDAILM